MPPIEENQIEDREVDEVTENAGDAEMTTEVDEGDDVAEGDDADTEAESGSTGDIVPAEYRQRYKELGGTCGDFIATELKAMMESGGLDALANVKQENDIAVNKWSSLNNGQQRMNLSNTLRASFLRGEMIKIGGREYSLDALRDEMLAEGGEFDASDRDQVDRFLGFASMPVTDRNAAAIKRYFFDGPRKAMEKAEREAKAGQTAEQKAAEKAAEKAAKAQKAKEEREAAKAERDEKAKARAAEKAEEAEKKKAEAADKKKAADEKKAAAAAKAAAAKQAKAEKAEAGAE